MTVSTKNRLSPRKSIISRIKKDHPSMRGATFQGLSTKALIQLQMELSRTHSVSSGNEAPVSVPTETEIKFHCLPAEEGRSLVKLSGWPVPPLKASQLPGLEVNVRFSLENRVWASKAQHFAIENWLSLPIEERVSQSGMIFNKIFHNAKRVKTSRWICNQV